MLLRLLVPVLLIAAAPHVRAQQPLLPPDVQLPLLVKVLSFDRSADFGSELVIGVLHQRGYAASAQTWNAWDAAARATVHTFGGRPVRVVAVEYINQDSLRVELHARRIDVLAFTPLRSANVRTLAQVARDAGVRTLTGDADDARSTGLALILSGGRARIVVNQQLAQVEGAAYSAQLLRVADVLRE